MTIKVLSGTYASGYGLHAPVSTLSITAGGYVEGTGIDTPTVSSVGYAIVNQGRIKSSLAGVYLHDGGSLTNGFAPTTTLGCGSWGGNSISENLDYKHLMNVSRIGKVIKDKKVPTDAEIWA